MTPDAAVQSSVTAFFKNPAIAKSVTELLLKKRPAGWSKTSNSPYYTSFYAKDIQPFVDEAIKTGNDLVFLYRKYPSLKPRTVYLRVNQSLLFLCDNMNDEYKYSNFKNMFDCITEPAIGIRFTLKEEHRTDGTKSAPLVVQPQSRSFIWREQIDQFLESHDKNELFIDRLLLSPEQIEDTKASLVGLKGIMYSITVHTVRIIRINE